MSKTPLLRRIDLILSGEKAATVTVTGGENVPCAHINIKCWREKNQIPKPNDRTLLADLGVALMTMSPTTDQQYLGGYFGALEPMLSDHAVHAQDQISKKYTKKLQYTEAHSLEDDCGHALCPWRACLLRTPKVVEHS